MTKEQLKELILDEIDEMLFIIDFETDRILHMNHKSMEILGLQSESEWKDKICFGIICGCDDYCENCSKEKILEQGSLAFECYNTKANIHLYKKFKLITIEGRKALLCIAMDISQIHDASLKLEKRLELEQTIMSCLRTLYEVEDMGLAINRLLSIIASFHAADRAYIFEFKDDGITMDNTYEWCNEGVTAQINILQNIEINVIDRWMTRFTESGEFYINSVENEVDKDSIEYMLLKQQGIESLFAAPLIFNGEIKGFLGVDNPSINTDTLMLLQSVAALVINDIHKRKNMAELYELSFHDRMTGTGNRHAYVKCMEELETDADKSIGIIFADINGLKKANDEFGHERGDNMIREVAGILKDNFKDNVFRVGGDEFVIFCVGADKDEFADKVSSIKNNWSSDVTASIGDLWFADCHNIEDKVNKADALMYDNKKKFYSKTGR